MFAQSIYFKLYLLIHPGPSYLLPSFHFIPFSLLFHSASHISFAVIQCMTHWHYINLPWFPTSLCALFKSFNVYIDLQPFHIHLHLLQTQFLFSDSICLCGRCCIIRDCIVSLNKCLWAILSRRCQLFQSIKKHFELWKSVLFYSLF